MKSNMKTKQLVLLALFSAIEIVLMLTPMGYIPIGPIRATTLHIPVILAGIVLGRNSGAGIGFVFGLTSLIINTMQPTATSFVFSPFITIGEYSGNLASLVIVFIPRIFLGWFSGVMFHGLMCKHCKKNTGIILTAIINTIIHTLSVMGLIYLFFGQAYAQARGIVYDELMGVILGIIATNGMMEAILAGFLVVAVVKALSPMMKEGKYS